MGFKEFKLNALLEVSKAINNNLAPEKLFLLLKFFLKNQLKIKKGCLLKVDDSGFSELITYGLSNQFNEDDFAKLKQFKDITYVGKLEQNPLPEFEAIIPIAHKFEIVAYLMVGDIEEHKDFTVTPVIRNLRFIQTLANLVVVAVENQILEAQKRENIKFRKELELASHIQQLLIPKELPKRKQFSVAAKYQPKDKIGGDYYDVIKLTDHSYFFCLCDISGKGITAAMIMANFQAILRGSIHRLKDFKAFITYLNKKVIELADYDYFVTFFGGVYNLETKELQYINAAHFPPIIKTENTNANLPTNIPGLGMVAELPNFEIQKLNITSPTNIIGFTDGATDVTNEKGEFFGEENLEKHLFKQAFLAPNEHIETTLNTIKQYVGKNGLYTDDLTLMSIRLN